MKLPLIPKTQTPSGVTGKSPLRPKTTANISPTLIVERLAPTGCYNGHPDAAIGMIYDVMTTCKSLEIERGPKAVDRYMIDVYDHLFGAESNEAVGDIQFIRHRVLTYLDVVGRIGSGREIKQDLMNHFIASWTGDIGKLDDLSKLLWNFEKEIRMPVDTKNGKKVAEKTERDFSGIIAQINERKAAFAAMGARNPQLAPMGKDFYRGRRDTQIHGVFLHILPFVKKGCFIRDIYRHSRDNEFHTYIQVSSMIAAHPELFAIDAKTGMVSFVRVDINEINAANAAKTDAAEKKTAPKAKPVAEKPAPKVAPKPTPRPKQSLTSTMQTQGGKSPLAPKAAVTPKTVAKAAPKPKTTLTPKKPIAAPSK